MTLNPITALLQHLEKLITEHGSSAILRDHLGLLREQFALSEKKVSSLENNVSELEMKLLALEKERDKLKSQLKEKDIIINDLHQEIETLNRILHSGPMISETDFDIFHK